MDRSVTSQSDNLAEGMPFEVLNASGQSQIVLVCEHASNFVPSNLARKLATDDVLQSHAGWDPGALDLAMRLSDIFDAPLVAAMVSRLVYDLNRPPESPDAMRATSEIHDIPGNATLTSAERSERIAKIYTPFHDAVAQTLRERPDPRVPTVLVTIHTFAPVYFGQVRDVQIGILHDEDSRFADAMLDIAPDVTDLKVMRNAPYTATDGVTHTLRKHALAMGLHNVMIEVRNDLVATAPQLTKMTRVLADMIGATLERLGITRTAAVKGTPGC